MYFILIKEMCLGFGLFSIVVILCYRFEGVVGVFLEGDEGFIL